MSDIEINRRNAFVLSAAASAGVLVPAEAEAGSAQAAMHPAPAIITTPSGLIVETKYGKVRGYQRNGIATFKGIPYGADTGGANRWLPPRPPAPWTGVRLALSYGPCCPQAPHAFSRSAAAFIYNWDDGYPGEDMLRLNVWTKSLSGKRPVMVWIHGGGFSAGSSQELPYYDGENLARQDVVLVSVNHRLNSLGFLDLSEIGGTAYRDSANVGILDLVAALEWVRDNIADFGGDPNKVMIFGQSGGGSKVTCLMGMPAARGLFHRARVQSGGGGGNMPDSAQSQKYAAQLMTELGLARNDIEGLQKMDWTKLNAAATEAARKINPSSAPNGVGIGGPNAGVRVGAGPTMDGRILPLRPFYDAAPDISKDIPMMIGSVHDEGTRLESQPTEAEWRAILAEAYGTPKSWRLDQCDEAGATQGFDCQTVLRRGWTGHAK